MIVIGMLIILYISCLITIIMLWWFNTDSLIDFGSLIGFSRFLKETDIEYIQEKIKYLPASLNYPSFLHTKYHNFITKLLSCRLCFSFWLSTISCVILYLVSGIFLSLLLIPPIFITSLTIYGIITKLINLPV